MKPLVALIWWITLLGTWLGFLPNLISWLSRALAAAQHIEKYTADILDSAGGIVGNTGKAAALKNTLAVAPRLVSEAEAIEKHLASVEAVLSARGRRARGARGES